MADAASETRLRLEKGWMAEFHKQLQRGKHVILYGNVFDRFLLTDPRQNEGRYVRMMRFLEQYLLGEGYEIVGRYDIVNALVMADPTVMQPRLQDALARAAGPAPAPEGTSRGDGERPRARGPTPGSARDPAAGLETIRAMLSQAEISAAVVLDFSDRMFGDPERQTEAELARMVRLRKTLQESALLRSGRLEGRMNTLIIVASHLGKLPPWLYQGNPSVALVKVVLPERDERVSYARRFLGGFFGGEDLPVDRRAGLCSEFAELTDSMTTLDLEAIRRTSKAEAISIARPRELVDYYKYGAREDPWEQLSREKVEQATKHLSQRVIGQEPAVQAILDMLIAAKEGIRMGPARAGRPKGVFFFVGPTGVGKTELAKALTGLIFGDDTAFGRFDMSEYQQEHAAMRLEGPPPSFVGYEEGGQLTNRVIERPFSLLLFDEIEKAHGRVLDKFLQILDEGRLTDGKGQTAYFSQTAIIFTSNIGSHRLRQLGGAFSDDTPAYEEVRRLYREAVEEHFNVELKRPELLGRLGENVIVFDILRPRHIRGICRKFFGELAESAKARRGLAVGFPDGKVEDLIVDRMSRDGNLLFGGRRIRALLEVLVERPLNRWTFLRDPGRGTTVTVSSDGARVLFNGEAEKGL